MLYIKCSTGDLLPFCFTATKEQASYINENLLPKGYSLQIIIDSQSFIVNLTSLQLQIANKRLPHGYSLQEAPIGQDKKNKKTKKIVKHKKQQKINKIKKAKPNNQNNSSQNIKITTQKKQIDQQIETILDNQNHKIFFALRATPRNKEAFEQEKQNILDRSEKQEDPEDFFRKIENMNQLYKQYFTPPKL